MVDVKLICAVPAVTVNGALLVSVVPKLIGVFPDNDIVPEPKLIVLEFSLLLRILRAVKLYIPQAIEPFVIKKSAPFPILNALASAHSEPTPLIVIFDAKATPLVVNVLPVLELDSVISPV